MSINGIGAVLIIAGCSSVGFSTAQAARREVRILQELIRSVSYMETALQFNLTPLPELCRQTSCNTSGTVREILSNLARELNWQTSPDVYSCMCEALCKSHPLSPKLRPYFLRLGASLGQFDLPGQIRELEGIRSCCEQELSNLRSNQDSRLRSYRTLGICAGTALAILLL